MLNFFIYFVDFTKIKYYKAQNNRKLKPKIVKKSIKIFTSLDLILNFFIFKKY